MVDQIEMDLVQKLVENGVNGKVFRFAYGGKSMETELNAEMRSFITSKGGKVVRTLKNRIDYYILGSKKMSYMGGIAGDKVGEIGILNYKMLNQVLMNLYPRENLDIVIIEEQSEIINQSSEDENDIEFSEEEEEEEEEEVIKKVAKRRRRRIQYRLIKEKIEKPDLEILYSKNYRKIYFWILKARNFTEEFGEKIIVKLMEERMSVSISADYSYAREGRKINTIDDVKTIMKKLYCRMGRMNALREILDLGIKNSTTNEFIKEIRYLQDIANIDDSIIIDKLKEDLNIYVEEGDHLNTRIFKKIEDYKNKNNKNNNKYKNNYNNNKYNNNNNNYNNNKYNNNNNNYNKNNNERNKRFKEKKCHACGKIGHIQRDCNRKREIICHGCKEKGHYANNCPKNKNRKENAEVKKIFKINSEEDSGIREIINGKDKNSYIVDLTVKSKGGRSDEIKVLADTGADVNVIDRNKIMDADIIKIKENNLKIKIGGEKIDVEGTVFLDCFSKYGIDNHLAFHVMNDLKRKHGIDAIIGHSTIDSTDLSLDRMKNQRKLSEYIGGKIKHLKGEEGDFTNDNIIEEVDGFEQIKRKLEKGNISEKKLKNNSSEEKEIMRKIFKEFPGVLDVNRIKKGANFMLNEIKFTDNEKGSRSKIKPNVMKEKEIQKELDKLENNNIIREIGFNYNKKAHVVKIIAVKKSDGTFRYCCDFREANKYIIHRTYRLYDVNGILIEIGLASEKMKGEERIFSKLDLKNGFYQFPLHDKNIGNFVIENGRKKYECLRLVFGIKAAPRLFQEAMDTMFKDTVGFNTRYIDDLLIMSDSVENHTKDLKEVIRILDENGLVINRDKCEFFREKISYLGYEISAKGVKIMNDKVQPIMDIKIPKNKKDIQMFLGMVARYTKFIENYAIIGKPLFKLLKKDIKFDWGEEQQKSFEKLKHILCIEPCTLALPRKKGDFVIYSDASGEAISAVIYQEVEGEFRRIACTSRILNKYEINYPIYEKEILACILGLKKFEHFIYGQKIKIYTDNRAFVYLRDKDQISARIARWIIYLGSFDAELIFIKGKKNIEADFFSRCVDYKKKVKNKDEKIISNEDFKVLMIKSINNSKDKLILEQENDLEIKKFKNFLKNNIIPEEKNEAMKVINNKNIILYNDIIYHSPSRNKDKIRIWLPNSMVKDVIEDYHSGKFGGHVGQNNTFMNISRKYYWPGMYLQIKDYIENCHNCQICYNPKDNIGYLNSIKANRPGEIVVMDIAGPLKTVKGFRYFIVIVDHFSKFLFTQAISDIKTKTVAQVIIEEYILRYGAPSNIISDRGSSIVSKVIKEIYRILNINKIDSAAYSAQTNGLAERFIGTIKERLRKNINSKQSDWVVQLKYVTFIMNASISASTGYSPFLLWHGRDVINPIDVKFLDDEVRSPWKDEFNVKGIIQNMNYYRKMAINNNDNARDKQANYYNRDRVSSQIEVSDLIILKNESGGGRGTSKKLSSNYKDVVYRVISINKGNAEIYPINKKDEKIQNVSLRRIKLYRTKGMINNAKEFEDDEYEVESIQGIEQTNKKFKFKVVWKGFTKNEFTWEPYDYVKGAKPHIETFLKKVGNLCN